MTQRAAALPARPRGGPLVMLLVLLAGWGTARAVLWENPFARLGAAHELPLAQAPGGPARATGPGPGPGPGPGAASVSVLPLNGESFEALALPFAGLEWRGGAGAGLQARLDAQLAAAHQLLFYAALSEPLPRAPWGADAAAGTMEAAPGGWFAEPVFLPAAAATVPGRAGGGRWALDAWAFWRQGSDASAVSQGRVPIYGASQAGAVLHYRLAPVSPRDPRLHLRAYRALVRRGESELALGASARPLARVPLRVVGELRYTDGAFSNAVRPAAYAVTELAPVALPLGASLEAYGQAGWVGGPGATAFADGQASITRAVPQVAALTADAVRVSLGAAAWGGAQEDAQRVDVGPTMRLDLTVGAVPARVSVDWRERVAGSASPASGVAATISTRF